MSYFAFVVLTFMLGIWVGIGWSAAELRARRARLDTMLTRINELEAVFSKWEKLLARVEREMSIPADIPINPARDS